MNEIIWIAIATLLASFVGTLSGFGIGTIMTPILLFFLPFSQTVFFVALIHWFHNIWKVFFFRKGVDWKLCCFFGMPGIITSYMGALFIIRDGSQVLSTILGVFLITYVLFLAIKPRFKLEKSWRTAIIGGGISGFFAGMFGIRGAIKSAFLSAFNLPKATYLATTGLISILMDSTRIFAYWYGGLVLDVSLTRGLLFFIPVSLVGSYIGQYFVHKIPQEKFRFVIAVFLLSVGIKLILFPIGN